MGVGLPVGPGELGEGELGEGELGLGSPTAIEAVGLGVETGAGTGLGVGAAQTAGAARETRRIAEAAESVKRFKLRFDMISSLKLT